MTGNRRKTVPRSIVPFFILAIILSSLILAAAGPSQAAEESAGTAKDTDRLSAPSPVFLGKNPLYADMKKVNGKYVITEVGSKPLLFRLNDLEPGVDTHRYYCTRHGEKFALEVTHPDRCRNDERTFRKVTVDIWKTLAEDFLTIGLNLLRGITEEYSAFDREEYRTAIEEALKNAGLDREKVLRAYDDFLASVRTMKSEAEMKYRRTLLQDMAVQFPVTVEDRSGLYRNDLTARDVIGIREGEMPAFDEKTVVFSAVDSASIEKALKDLKNQYARELSLVSAFYPLDKSASGRHYNFRVDAPDRIFLKDGLKQTIPLHVTVFSKTLTDVSPLYRNENSDVRIEDDGKAIMFFNKTGCFIQIDSFSILCEKHAAENPLNVGLAPGAFISLDRGDRRLRLPPRQSYFNATLDSVKDLSLTYGYTLRYSILGEKAVRTLQKVETHAVRDLLG